MPKGTKNHSKLAIVKGAKHSKAPHITKHQPAPRLEVTKKDSPKQNRQTSRQDAPKIEPIDNDPGERPPFIAQPSKLVPIGDLSPHPLNEKIYGQGVDASFVSAVRRNGIYDPLLITQDNKVISGNRRLEAAKQAGIREVPVVVFDSDDDLDIREAIVAANRQRVKSHEQIGREFKVLLEVETERARVRMGKGVENFPQDMVGKSRDIAVQRLGVCGKTGEHAAAVVDKIDEMNAAGNNAEAEELRRKLNKSVNGAFNRIKVLNLREQHGDTPASQAEVHVLHVDGKADIITRLQEKLVEATESWSLEKLRALEEALPGILNKFAPQEIQRQEAA